MKSADAKHDFCLLNMLKKASTQNFDLDVENPLGGGTLAKIESPLYRADGLKGSSPMFSTILIDQYSSPQCHSESRKVCKSHRAGFKPNLERFDLAEWARFIGASNHLIGTLFGARNRAGSCASFEKSYRNYGVQITPKEYRGLKIQFQLSTKVSTKVTTF
jgi:hypothetical protein